jgi:hypothetical protein
VVVLFVEIVTKKCMIMIAYKEVYDWLFMLRFLSMYKVCCRIVATHKKKTWSFLDLLPLIPLGYIVTVITHYMNEFVLCPSGGPPSMSCNQVVVISRLLATPPKGPLWCILSLWCALQARYFSTDFFGSLRY